MTKVDFDWETGKSPTAFIAKLATFETLLDARLREAMEEATLIVEATAKRFAPVDTGNLRASIASEVRTDVADGVAGYVGTNVQYAPFQEFGTSRMNAQPFIRPAIEQHRDQIMDKFESAITTAAVGAGLA